MFKVRVILAHLDETFAELFIAFAGSVGALRLQPPQLLSGIWVLVQLLMAVDVTIGCRRSGRQGALIRPEQSRQHQSCRQRLEIAEQLPMLRSCLEIVRRCLRIERTADVWKGWLTTEMIGSCNDIGTWICNFSIWNYMAACWNVHIEHTVCESIAAADSHSAA